MNKTSPLKMLVNTSIVTVLLSQPFTVLADQGEPQVVADLKACIDANVADEQAKEAPSADALLSLCSNEYDALIAVVPQETVESVRHHLVHDVEGLLND